MLSIFNGPAFFVGSAGTLVTFLTLFIVAQVILQRNKNNRLTQERIFLREQYDAQLLTGRIEVQEETFNSIGNELHDNIGQLLSTVRMFLGLMEQENKDPVSPLLNGALSTTEKAITEMRSLTKLLDRSWLESFDLYRHLAAEGERINETGKLRVEIYRNSHLLPLASEKQFLLFRLLQEGIQNVVKHADARKLDIRFLLQKNDLITELQDDGNGFDITQQHAGLGLKNMRTRAKAMGASISWQSGAQGTLIRIITPVEKLSA